MKIFLLQESSDINYYKFVKNFKDTFVLPLSLSSLVQCHRNNFKYINPIGFIGQKFHKKNLLDSEKFKKNVIFKSKLKKFLKDEIIFYLSSRFNSVVFLRDLLISIEKKYKINKIYIPNKIYDQHEIDTFFLNEIFEYYLTKYEVIKINIASNTVKEEKKNLFTYSIKNKINNNKKNILLNDLGYNLKRIIYLKIFKKINIYFFNENKINKIKYLVMNILKIYPINLEKRKKKILKYNHYAKINKNLLGKNFSKLFLIFLKKFNFHFEDYNEKAKTIKNFFLKNKFKLIIVNSLRETARLILEVKGKKQKLLNIPHGTVSESFTRYDKIYKDNIANSVVSRNSDYVAAQSKISEKYFLKNKYDKTKIIKGNLIFSEVKQKSKNFILYAVTTKQFYNMHFLGVEMYYELFENLKYLNKISKDNNFKIVVKLHPSESNNAKDLSKIFPNLHFSNLSLEKLLRKSFVTLSFSSTVIEDSLNSRIPVILFDRWNRYKHCSVSNSDAKKFPIFYASNKNKLLNCIKKVKKASDFDFKDIIFLEGYKKNLEKQILNLI